MTLRLKSNQLRTLPEGRHHDGAGLYFVRTQRGGNWLYRYTLDKRAREMGLGSWPAVGLAQARELAAKARVQKAMGTDPITARAAVRRQGATFEDVAREYWGVHCQQLARPQNWLGGMEANVFPAIGKRQIASLTPEDLVPALKPIWHHEKTRKLRQWIGAVIAYAAHDVPGVDLDLIRKLDAKLGPQKIVYDHHPAIPWKKIPDLWSALPATRVGMSMRILILTATRLGAVTQMKWDEIDFKNKIWIIPPEPGRLKSWKHAFRVPLTRTALDTLRVAQKRFGGTEYIFPGDNKTGYLSNGAHRLWLQDNGWTDADGKPATVHGFRSSFRDFADEKLRADPAIAEHCLLHISAKGNKTAQAYHRNDQLDRRRELMNAWCDYIVKTAKARYRIKNGPFPDIPPPDPDDFIEEEPDMPPPPDPDDCVE